MFHRSPFARRSDLAGLATLAYGVVVVLASLYPAEGWRLPDLAILQRQLGEWPRYYSYTDVTLNVAGYVPLGFLLTTGLRHRMRPMVAASLAFAVATLLSCCLELVQGGIPLRVPSGLDVFCNAVGGLLGAWIALFFRDDSGEGRGARWYARVVDPAAGGDAGVVLAALWVLAQFRPDLWLFATGDLRHLLDAPLSDYSPRTYILLEAGVALMGIVAAAGVARVLITANALGFLLILVTAGLVARAAATALLYDGGHAFLWVTPGNAIGIALGLVLGGAACSLSRQAAALAAFAAMLGGVVLLNGAPTNPYADLSPIQAWQQGHYRSVVGTTRIVSMGWPLLAGLFLLRHARRAG